jgi:hypothetical protein
MSILVRYEQCLSIQLPLFETIGLGRCGVTSLIQSHFCVHGPSSKTFKKHDVSEEQPGSETSFLKSF